MAASFPGSLPYPSGLILLSHRIKKYPDFASTRFRIHSVFKNYLSGERIRMPETPDTSLVPRRSLLGQSWTLPWAVTSPRYSRRERLANKRVRSSNGRSQDCMRLGTSWDKSCFDLLELSFLTITVFWERKLRAQGFLHKEMRICAVVGCNSSTYQLQKWRKGFCTSHKCHRTSQDCTCPDLF